MIPYKLNYIYLAALLTGSLALTACASDPLTEDSDLTDNSTTDSDDNTAGSGDAGDTAVDLFTFDVSLDDVADDGFTDTTETVPTDESNEEYDDYLANSSFSSTIAIHFSGSSATVSGAVDGVSVTTSGAHVTINSSATGVEYVLSGTSTDGAVKVYSDKKFKLTLNGLTLTSATGAPINIQSGKRVFVDVADGTENVLTDAANYTDTPADEDQRACLFSEGQLLFSGSGLLTVNGRYKHGICSDDYVYIHSGTRIVVASAPKDGIHANDKIVINGGLLKLYPSGDGLDCEEGSIALRGGLLKAQITGTASKAVKAETDITVTGGQQLLLTSGSATYDTSDSDLSSASAVKCGGNFKLSGGTLAVKSTGSGGKGINADGTLTISGGTAKVITTGRQYVYGSLDSSPKGIKADGTLTISGGAVWVRTTGGEGSEGIESKSSLVINDGTVGVYAYDDCINATSSIAIGGGNIYCYSSNNDGIDSNGTLTVSGGLVIASGTTAPEEGFDCDQNTFKITGGTLLGIGGATSTPTASVSTQRSVIYGGSASKGTLLSIIDSEGSQVMSFTVPRDYNQMTLLFSSSSLSSDDTYSITTGGTVSGGSSFYGFTTGGSLSDATTTATFTPTDLVTTIGSTGGTPGGGNGGGPGGPGGGNGGNTGGGPGGRP